jgi:hypothetical protein
VYQTTTTSSRRRSYRSVRPLPRNRPPWLWPIRPWNGGEVISVSRCWPGLFLQLPSHSISRRSRCCSARGSCHQGPQRTSLAGYLPVTSRFTFPSRLTAPVSVLRAVPGPSEEGQDYIPLPFSVWLTLSVRVYCCASITGSASKVRLKPRPTAKTV